jgi:hypothetical protein
LGDLFVLIVIGKKVAVRKRRQAILQKMACRVPAPRPDQERSWRMVTLRMTAH